MLPEIERRVTALERHIRNGLTLARLTLTGALTGASASFTSLSITAGAITSGTYTPTLNNTTNVASSTPETCQYFRVGNVGHVSGRLTVTPTGSGAVVLGHTLPITSDIGALREVAGVAAAAGQTYDIEIRGDTTNNRANFAFTAPSGAAVALYYTFTFLIT